MKQFLPLLMLLLLPLAFASAQTNGPSQKNFPGLATELRFEENNGQLTGANGKPDRNLLYVLRDKHMDVFFTRKGLVYNWHYLEKKPGNAINPATGKPYPEAPDGGLHPERQNLVLHTKTAEMHWVKNNVKATVLADSAFADVNHYYYANTTVNNVKSYRKITYKNIYPNTDVVYYIKGGKLEYDVILHPGADVKKVKLTYKGDGHMSIDSGRINLKNSLGTLTEQQPIAYANAQPVKVKYRHQNNEVSFDVENADELINKTTVIDPTITWGTYYGGPSEDGATSTAKDASGNVFLTGYTQSRSGIASATAYQSGGGGVLNYDAFLVKFDSGGNRLWATYYGGTSGDVATGVASDGTNAIIVGYTQSRGMASDGAAQDTLRDSDFDAFVAKFNSAGIRTWGTYYGGKINNGNGVFSGEDAALSVATDGSGNIFFTGYTYSPTFPTLGTIHQINFKGYTDGFLVKLNSGGGVAFSTYFGGESYDSGQGVGVAPSGQVYICGKTSSATNISSGIGVFQSSYGTSGRTDGFLASFATGGGFAWATYFGGYFDDALNAVAVDSENSIYVTGSAQSAGLTTLGAYQTGLAGSDDAVLAKFNQNGNIIWGTYYGGTASDIGYAIGIDPTDNIYIGGSTKSNTGIYNNGFKENYSPGFPSPTDGFVTKFNKAGALQWGSYLGGSGDDVIKGISIANNYVYLGGVTASTSGIASGGFQFAYGGDVSDGFLVKIEGSNNPPVDNTPRQSSNIVFTNNLSDKVTLTWTNGTGTNRIVMARTADATFPNPADGGQYPNNNTYSTGYPADANTKVVYRGSDNTVTINGLTANTTYYFKVFDYTGVFERDIVYNRDNATGNPASVTIGKTGQTITFAGPITKTYGDVDFSPATASSGLAVNYSSSNNAVANFVAGKIHITGVGEVDITATQAGNTTYGAATPVTTHVIVNKAVITARSLDRSKIYGDANPEFLPAFEGFKNGESTFVLSVYPTLSTTATTSSPTGTYPILITGAAANNYTFNYVAGNLTVNKAILTVTADDKIKAQGQPNPPLTVSFTGFKNADNVTNLTTIPVAVTTATTSSPAGPYPITVDGGLAINYTFRYNPGTLSIGKLSQAIIFAPISPKAPGDADFSTGASASSGLPISYNSSNTAVATVSATGVIHIVGVGTVTITAAQAGNGSYFAATAVEQVLSVAQKTQTITFAPMPEKHIADVDFSPGATASSGRSVTYSSSNTAVATVSPEGYIHIVGAGTAIITASQAGNITYSAASPATQTLTVSKRSQTITFPPFGAYYVGDVNVPVNAAASSGLPVTYTSSNTAVATIVGGQIHVIGAGTTTITAAQPGNATYAAAQLVQRELTIGKTPQTITFAPFADEEVTAADFFADGTASSGLAVTYTSSNTAVAAIVNGNMIHPVGVGITIITASQAGDAAYAAATPIQRELKIIKAGQYITLDRFGKIPFGNPDVEPRITKSTDLPVTLTSSNPAVATIVNGKIHLVGAGTTTITATVAGDARYLPASSEPQTLVVDKARQTISFELIADKALGSPDFDLVASSTSGLPITFTPTPSRPAVATVTDGRVHIVGTGFLTIAANQPGNDNYLPATVFYRTLQVYTRQPQTIAFAPFADVNIDEADFFANGHALSELPVTYTSSNPAVATIVGDMIHIVGLGTATITASQAGNDHWLAAPNVSQNLTVIKANQYISFSSMGKRTFGQPDFVPPATASSGLPLTFTSSDLSVATIVDGKIHIVGSGSSTITASQAGNERYFAAANQTGLLAVTSALQTITFAELPPKTTTDADFDLTATASSGFAVTYTSSNTSVATVSGNTVHILRAGTTNIKASQVGGAGYQAAPDVTRVLTVGKTAQTINFAALTTAQLSDPDFDPKAAATSGLPVTYISSNPAVAIIIDGKIHYIGAGTTDITALQAGDATYSAAAPVIRSQTVTNIIGQTITFANFGKKALGDIDFNPNATSSAGLPVTLTSDNPAVATIVDGKIHLVGVGAANITASQPGNATTSPAEPVSRFLIVDKQFQSISFNNISNRKFNSPDITLVATSSVGLPVTFTTSNAIVAVILNGKLHIVGVGPVTITATQGGNETVAAAVPVLRTLTITKGTQTITFPALGNKNFSDADIDPNATASSTLPVGLESSNTAVATIVDGKIHLVGLGITTITASQVGDDHWEAALPVSYTITVSKGKQTITFPIVTDKLVSIPDFDPLATASSGLKIIYTSNNPSIATIVDGKVHAVRAGNVKITASQPGNELYRPAPNAVRSIHFSNLSIQTITFPAMAKKDYGIPDFNFVASTNSGLPLTIVSSNPAVAVVIDGKVHIVGAGFTTFTVSQPGNDAIAAATPVSRQFTVQKADQTITFTAIPEKLVTDADFEIKAASSSGLPVTFTNENPLVFTLTGNMVHILLAASGKVTATQLGNANYNAARGVSQFIVIRPIAQTIAFEPLPAKLVNDADVILTATASSGLAVTYASSNPAVATIVDGKLHIIGAGTTQITASQAGNTTIGFAADVTRAFVVNKVPQTITFDADRISVGIPFTLTATASSGLPVTYTVTDDTYATIVGSVLTGLRRGAVSVTAIQAGNETYAAATPVSKTINITQDLAIRPNNVLSPNGDGHNDVWVITNIEDYPANNVRVYNRANHLVFEANNYHNDWGGTERGGILTQDAYLYVINLGNGSPVITGYITLVR